MRISILCMVFLMTGVIASTPGIASEIDADKAKSLHNNLGCAGCHSFDHKTQVGPGYKKIAERYDMNEETVARLIKAVRTGSSGEWGPIEMPRMNPVSEEEAELLVNWILSLE